MSANLDYDVAIVGAGDVGAAIARELARFDLRLALIEAGPDVGAGTSKANTAILHTGFDAKPETLEARLVARGHDLLHAPTPRRSASRSSEPARCWSRGTTSSSGAFPRSRTTRDAAATTDARVGADELYRREPHLGPGAARRPGGARRAHRLPLHAADRLRTQAVLAGAELRRWERVTGMERLEGGWRLAHLARLGDRGLGDQRRRAPLGRGRPDGRPRRVHGHPQARRVDRVRQAQPAAGEPRPAAGADRDHQGGPRGAHGVRQRDPRPDRGGHRAQGRHRLDRRGHRPAAGRGPAHHAQRCSNRRRPPSTSGASRDRARATISSPSTASEPTPAPAASARPG